MKANPLPPIEELRRLFNYDPETGVVTRKVSAGRTKKGAVVTSKTNNGYCRVAINGRHFFLHRVCYAIYHGRDPYPMQCDHVNHDRTDNRICNLRLVTNQENQKNASKRKDNTSGISGVSLKKGANKWVAQIRANGKRTYLGTFINKSDAIAARKAAEIKYGFHKNHGHYHDAPEQQPPVEISDEVRQLSLRLIQPVDDESAPQKKPQECRA